MSLRRFAVHVLALLTALTGLALAPARPAGAQELGGLEILDWWVDDASWQSASTVTLTVLVGHEPGKAPTSLAVDDDWDGTTDLGQILPIATRTRGARSLIRRTLTPQPPPVSCFDPTTSLRAFDGPLRFRVLGPGLPGRSDTVTVPIHLVASDNCQVLNSSGFDQVEDFPFVLERTQSATQVAPGDLVTFGFSCLDADVSRADHSVCQRAEVRARRVHDDTTTTPVLIPSVGDGEEVVHTMAFDERGRWVVEVRLGNEDDPLFDDDHEHAWWRIGTVEVNDPTPPAVDVTLEGQVVHGADPIPSVNQFVPVEAVVDVSDVGAGSIDLVEWNAQPPNDFERVAFAPFTEDSLRQRIDTEVPGVRGATVRVTDDGALSSLDDAALETTIPAAVRVNARPVLDLPPGPPGPQLLLTDEDTPVTFSVPVDDPDDQPGPLVVEVLNDPDEGTLVCSGTSCTYTPAPDFSGTDHLAVRGADGPVEGEAWTTSLPLGYEIRVRPVADPPTADDQAASTPEDQSLPITLTGSDPEGAALVFEIDAPPEHGTLSGTAPDLAYTPDPDFNGPDAFTFTVSDGLLTTTGTVDIEVTPVNDAPMADDDTVSTVEDELVEVELRGTDVDGDELSFAIRLAPANGALLCDGAACTYTPAAEFSGVDAFGFEVDDGNGGRDDGTIAIEVLEVDDAPVAVDAAVATAEDTPVEIALAATDVDDEELTFEVDAGPEHGTLSGTAPDLTYTPDPDFDGPDRFTFTVSDGDLTATGTVDLEVTSVNDAPVATPASVQVDEDGSVAFALAATDVDDEVLTFGVATAPEHGTLTCDGAGSCTYVPAPDYEGPDAATFVVRDGSEATATAPITFDVVAAPLVATQLDPGPPGGGQGVYRARLTRADTGQPIQGRTVQLRALGAVQCTAVTDADGWASCGPSGRDLLAVLGLGYRAHFDGDHDFLASDAVVPLLRLSLLGLPLW